jgi:hypothetical protein
MPVDLCNCGKYFDNERFAHPYCSSVCRERADRNLKPPKPVGKKRTLSVAEAWIDMSDFAAADPPRHIDGTPRGQPRTTLGA